MYFYRAKEEQIGYFRKVNFLVKFFENIDHRVENLQKIYVDQETAETLLKACEEVLADHDKAAELLPTTEGFFFGSTEYDDDYFNDVEGVRNYVKRELLPQFDNLEEDEHIYFEIWY